MHKVFGWSLAGVICMFGIASAQVRPALRPAAAPPAVAPTAPAANSQGTADQQIAACLWMGAHNEVELAKLAQQHAKSDSVKDFAAKMTKDHSQQADKLAKIAGNLVHASTARGEGDTRREVRKAPADETGREEGRKEAREDRKEGRDEARAAGDREERRAGREEAREDRREGREEGTTAAAGGRHAFNWVTVHREIGEKCLQSTKKELSQKEGNEFDQCYMGMQIAAHMKMLDELKVFQNYATGPLHQDIEEDIDTAEHHLKDARKIMDELKDKGSNNRDRDEK